MYSLLHFVSLHFISLLCIAFFAFHFLISFHVIPSRSIHSFMYSFIHSICSCHSFHFISFPVLSCHVLSFPSLPPCIRSFVHSFLSLRSVTSYGWLSKLGFLFGYPKYSAPYYIRDPKWDHNFDNHSYNYSDFSKQRSSGLGFRCTCTRRARSIRQRPQSAPNLRRAPSGGTLSLSLSRSLWKKGGLM